MCEADLTGKKHFLTHQTGILKLKTSFACTFISVGYLNNQISISFGDQFLMISWSTQWDQNPQNQLETISFEIVQFQNLSQFWRNICMEIPKVSPGFFYAKKTNPCFFTQQKPAFLNWTADFRLGGAEGRRPPRAARRRGPRGPRHGGGADHGAVGSRNGETKRHGDHWWAMKRFKKHRKKPEKQKIMKCQVESSWRFWWRLVGHRKKVCENCRRLRLNKSFGSFWVDLIGSWTVGSSQSRVGKKGNGEFQKLRTWKLQTLLYSEHISKRPTKTTLVVCQVMTDPTLPTMFPTTTSTTTEVDVTAEDPTEEWGAKKVALGCDKRLGGVGVIM